MERLELTSDDPPVESAIVATQHRPPIIGELDVEAFLGDFANEALDKFKDAMKELDAARELADLDLQKYLNKDKDDKGLN